MADHTPMTEEVRQAYATAHETTGASMDEREFDRWLIAHNRKIAAEALRTEAFSGLYGTFAQARLLDRANRIEQGGES